MARGRQEQQIVFSSHTAHGCLWFQSLFNSNSTANRNDIIPLPKHVEQTQCDRVGDISTYIILQDVITSLVGS